MEHLAIYIQSHILSLIFLAVLYGIGLKYWRPRVFHTMSGIYLLTALSGVTDIIWALVEGNPALTGLSHVVNVINLSSFGFIGFLWLDYCAAKTPFGRRKGKWVRWLCALPAVAEMLLVAASAFTGWVYGIDANGVYFRGPLYCCQLVAYVYLAAASLLALKARRQVEFYLEKKMYRTMALFALPPFVLSTLQLLVPPGCLPAIQSSIVLALLIQLIDQLESYVTQDSLTGLSNRYVLDRLIDQRIGAHKKSRDREKDLYLFIGDLDDFKSINDTYGHLEGDRALCMVAEQLKNVLPHENTVLSRMGGDEFAVLLEIEPGDAPERWMERINRALAEASEGEFFDLNMSIGVVRYKAGLSGRRMVEEADRALYEIKRAHKAVR